MARRSKKPLKIVMFPDMFLPYTGGAELWAANIAKELSVLGHHVEIDSYRMPIAPSDEVLGGVAVRRIGWPFVLSDHRDYATRFLMLLLGCVRRIILENQIDIVIGQFTPLIPLNLACKMKGIPLLAVFHDTFGRKLESQTGLIRGLLMYMFGDVNVRRGFLARLRYDGAIAVSEIASEKLKQIGCRSTNIAIIRNGIDTGLIDSIPSIPRNLFQICYVGRLAKSKNLTDLIQAFALVFKKEPRAKLVVAGEGEEKESVITLTENLGLTKSVSITGHVSEVAKYRLMKSSKVFVFPSREGEAWGNVVTEAAYCGLGVIGYEIPALREQARFLRNITLVRTPDFAALSDAILAALRSRSSSVHRNRMVVRSYFSWRNSAMKLEQLIYNVLAQPQVN